MLRPSRPSPAMVIACLSLFVALTGTSIAAVSQLVPRNSVGTAQLRDNAVARTKIRNNTINAAKVANRSLLAIDFAAGQLPAGPAGPAGPTGAAGAAGPAGPAGPPGVSGYEIVTASNSVTSDSFNSVTVPCPAGKRVFGGGSINNVTGATTGPYIHRSVPSTDGTSWTIGTTRNAPGSWTMTGYAVCGTVG